ncbi:hypothetical protein EJ04DRAFT_517362 [Polyplosphaeria fusca]|uniref:Uncharacterized protein n=1 Tax=Polyplosphaeria fusca TaxID=682080 RepID=A0A9P4UVX8_9PLEO|nr:hypothetical protein EJ04DRAFT_517362 [Polyplosphaeria fusca]
MTLAGLTTLALTSLGMRPTPRRILGIMAGTTAAYAGMKVLCDYCNLLTAKAAGIEARLEREEEEREQREREREEEERRERERERMGEMD